MKCSRPAIPDFASLNPGYLFRSKKRTRNLARVRCFSVNYRAQSG